MKIKKIITIGLLAIMAVSAISISAFAFTDISDSRYKDNIDFLTQYNILSGDDDKFYPNNNITRAEAAKMMLYARNVTEEDLSLSNDNTEEDGIVASSIEEPNYSYTDISSEHWGYQYIIYASQLGLMSGFDDGTIRPDDDVTYAQFLAMAVRAIGYDLYADEVGGYPNGYYTIAKTLNLTGGLEAINLDTLVTRETAAQIIYHTIQVPVLVIDSYDFSGGTGKPIMVVCDGTDGTTRRTLLSRIQSDDNNS